jgi:hypothetical protein
MSGVPIDGRISCPHEWLILFMTEHVRSLMLARDSARAEYERAARRRSYSPLPRRASPKPNGVSSSCMPSSLFQIHIPPVFVTSSPQENQSLLLYQPLHAHSSRYPSVNNPISSDTRTAAKPHGTGAQRVPAQPPSDLRYRPTCRHLQVPNETDEDHTYEDIERASLLLNRACQIDRRSSSPGTMYKNRVPNYIAPNCTLEECTCEVFIKQEEYHESGSYPVPQEEDESDTELVPQSGSSSPFRRTVRAKRNVTRSQISAMQNKESNRITARKRKTSARESVLEEEDDNSLEPARSKLQVTPPKSPLKRTQVNSRIAPS